MFHNIECYMIVIANNTTSRFYADYCKLSWQNCGISVCEFDAITPQTINNYHQLRFAKYSIAHKYTSKGLKAEITETEKACWYSHFLLWQKCVDEDKPLLIMEHDSYIEYPNNLWYNEMYGVIFFDKAAMGSYVIQPWFAKKLVAFSTQILINNGPYATIHEFGRRYGCLFEIVNSEHSEYKPASNQVMSKAHGSTVEHFCTNFPHHWPAECFHKFKEID